MTGEYMPIFLYNSQQDSYFFGAVEQCHYSLQMNV